MPELGPYGSVRGARGNSRPYRESGWPTVKTARLTRSEHFDLTKLWWTRSVKLGRRSSMSSRVFVAINQSKFYEQTGWCS